LAYFLGDYGLGQRVGGFREDADEVGAVGHRVRLGVKQENGDRHKGRQKINRDFMGYGCNKGEKIYRGPQRPSQPPSTTRI
jgi:hypothetical protein